MAKFVRGRMVAAVALVALLTVLVVRPVAAEEDQGNNFGRDFGMGVGAIFTNIVYMPVKFVYATLGSITGGFAYVLTGLNLDLAKGIWVPSMGGTYIVTPSMLKGEDKIMFSGTTEPKRHQSRHEEEDLSDSNSKRDADGEGY